MTSPIFKIRPFDFESVQDYQFLVETWNESFPEMAITIEKRKHFDHNFDREKFLEKRYIAENQQGKLLGYYTVHHMPEMHHPQKFGFFLVVEKTSRCQGVGLGLYEHLLEQINELNPISLLNFASDKNKDGLRFLEKQGFTEKMRFIDSELSLADFDMTGFEGIIEKVESSCIELTTESELRLRYGDTGPTSHWHKLYDLLMETSNDVPSPEPQTLDNLTFENFLTRTRDYPERISESYFIALENDHYVASSSLVKSETAGTIETGLTGTRKSYRRNNIALALKLKAIAYAKAKGYQKIVTGNESYNQPMLAINKKLGFEETMNHIDFIKEFGNT